MPNKLLFHTSDVQWLFKTSGHGTTGQESCEGEKLFLNIVLFVPEVRELLAVIYCKRTLENLKRTLENLKLEKEAPMHINILQIDCFINKNEESFCLFAFLFRKFFSLGKQYSQQKSFRALLSPPGFQNHPGNLW